MKKTPTQTQSSTSALVTLLSAALIVLLVAILLWFLRSQVNKSYDSELLITQLESEANRLSADEWQAIAEGSLSSELSKSIQSTQSQLKSILHQIQLSASDQTDLLEILRVSDAYVTAMSEELALIQTGDLEQAREIDEQEVDPSFKQLREQIQRTSLNISAQKARTAMIADLLSVILVLAAIVIPGFFFWRYQSARYLNQLAQVEQQILHESQSELESQVLARTEELSVANHLLSSEVKQRKIAEAELQQAKDVLESLVIQRTRELEDANRQLHNELTERKRSEAKISASLKEKEILLQEIHHRVKNNLQIISSLLFLQSDKIKDPNALTIFRDSQNRIRSIALIHEKLYQSKDLAYIDLNGYIQNLVSHLQRSYGIRDSIQLHIGANDVQLSIDHAMPCGMIINELISNALKHAFPDNRHGDIYIDLSTDGDAHYKLRVYDNGVGFPAPASVLQSTSLGLQLVETLVQQIDGTLDFRTNGGTEFVIRFARSS